MGNIVGMRGALFEKDGLIKRSFIRGKCEEESPRTMFFGVEVYALIAHFGVEVYAVKQRGSTVR